MFIRCYSKLMAYATCNKTKSICRDCEKVWGCEKEERLKLETCDDFRKAKAVSC